MKRFEQILYLILIFITSLDIILLASITFYQVDSVFRIYVLGFDLVVCIILWIEFLYNYSRSDKEQYLKDNALSIIGMLPFDFIFLRALRLIKLVQLIQILFVDIFENKSISKFLKETFLDKIIVFSIIFVFLLTVLIFILEPNIDMPNSFWYVIVSMTNTGYGDVIPETITGRLLGIITMVGGILIFATVTAVISSQYVLMVSKKNSSLESKIDDLSSEIEKLNKKIDELKKD